MQGKFQAVERELNALYLERQEVVRGLIVALIAGHHVLLLGPPGTAKSALVEDLCQRIGGQYFRYLLTRFSAPEELLGPVSLAQLEQDRYMRVTTGRLPEAHIAFLDEIFKANSAILNSLLTMLNERLFVNDGTPTCIPLEMCVGASNEMPEDREELGALYDRFLLRYVVEYVRDPRSFEALLAGGTTGTEQITTLDLATVQAARTQASQVDVSRIIPQIATLRAQLAAMAIVVSDRRWKQCLSLIRAHAWLEGRQAAEDQDLAILTGALWQEPEQIPQVKTAILNLANPYEYEAQNMRDAALEAYEKACQTQGDDKTSAGLEAVKKLKHAEKTLQELAAKCQAAGKDDHRIVRTLEEVAIWKAEVAQRCLEL